jgi:membrane protein
MRGMVIGGYRVGPLLKKTAREIRDDGVTTLAAQTAYYFFFSLFPLFLFLAPMLSLVVDRQTLISVITQRFTGTLPPAAVLPLRLVVENVINTNAAPGLVSLGILFAAWSGSNIFGALTTALNTAYDVEEDRTWIKRQARSLLMVLIGGVVVIGATVVMLGGEDVARWVGTTLALGPVAVKIWDVVQFPAALLFVVALVFLIYWLLPNVRQRKRHALVAAVVAVVLWVVATLLFRLYVQHFPPNPAYGLVGAVMILLTWMYYTMFVVLAAGELASELHHGSGAVEPPKGATYIGRIVSGDEPGSPSLSTAG